MPGGDLSQQLEARDSHPFSEIEVKHLLYQVCQALKYLHDRNIVHRDIKLENVVLKNAKRGCVAKLSDFGLAAYASDEALMGNGEIVGTPGYIAPEVMERQPCGKSSDIWSLGCLIFSMLTARMYPDPLCSF